MSQRTSSSRFQLLRNRHSTIRIRPATNEISNGACDESHESHSGNVMISREIIRRATETEKRGREIEQRALKQDVRRLCVYGASMDDVCTGFGNYRGTML